MKQFFGYVMTRALNREELNRTPMEEIFRLPGRQTGNDVRIESFRISTELISQISVAAFSKARAGYVLADLSTRPRLVTVTNPQVKDATKDFVLNKLGVNPIPAVLMATCREKDTVQDLQPFLHYGIALAAEGHFYAPRMMKAVDDHMNAGLRHIDQESIPLPHLMLADMIRKPAETWENVLATTSSGPCMITAWDEKTRLVHLISHKWPLWILDVDGVTYWSSQPFSGYGHISQRVPEQLQAEPFTGHKILKPYNASRVAY